jgi:CheY-like chemotaxis protein
MPKTLLLADDSVTIQKVVGISLANEDIELVTVENGDDAVSQAQEIRPDIVLADIVMPGKNGYEVCETIKNDPQLAATPVLLLTGTFEAFDAERARQVGADGHITKPFEAQALVDQVNQLLARSTPLGDDDVRQVTNPPAPAPQAGTTPLPAPTPPADVGANGEGGDAFDFFDGADGDADTSWPTEAGRGDTSGIDLMSDSTPDLPRRGQAEETVLLDPNEGSGDPAFDAAVEAAAFDAPGERNAFQEPDESGFDLESADLSMASSVPDVVVAPDSMSFSEADAPHETTAPTERVVLDDEPAATEGERVAIEDEPAATERERVAIEDEPAPVDPAPVAVAPAPAPDPLVDFDPASEAAAPASPATPVQVFDETGMDTDAPGEHSATVLMVEDEDPVRVQAPGDVRPTAPAAPAPSTASTTPEIPPALQQAVHATLEKVAWEAFSDLSEQVVKQVLARVEAIAWEVIPQMAETLVKEEIARMQSSEGDEE